MKFSIWILLSTISLSVFSQKPFDIELPSPIKTGGKPFMETLNDRQTLREFSDLEFSNQKVSDMLWAAYGINRPDQNKRTAPSARNVQEFEIYVILKGGIYVYDAVNNILIGIAEGDHRAEIGRQDFVATAPMILVFVADFSKYSENMDEQTKNIYAGIDCGYISQNVYLYAASEGLATVVLGSIHKDKIKNLLLLSDSKKAILAQPIGYVKNRQ